MKIKLTYEKYKKDLIDIVRIFPNQDLEFVADSPYVIEKSRLILDKEYKFENKLDLKRILYNFLSEKTAYKSPWGLTTGTKPQKLFKNHSEKDLLEKFLISPDKIKLLGDIQEGHQGLKFDKNNIHLYINIPFCPSRCSYCSFPTIIYGKNDRRAEYIEALKREIRAFRQLFLSRKIRSIYIGGGTPSALTYDQSKSLLDALKEEIDLSSLEEFTIEAGREDTLDLEKLKLYKSYNVSRISINPQSFKKETIEKIGRNQDMRRLEQLFLQAKEMGFIVNMDLILGLEDEGLGDLKDTFEHIAKLMPQNLTVHTLSIKKGSILSQNRLSLDEERQKIADMVALSQDMAAKLAYRPYYLYRQKEILGNFENVGYTLAGKICLYNVVTNEETESILGLGMTSNSKIWKNGRLEKYTNYKNLDDYIKNLDQEISEKINLLK